MIIHGDSLEVLRTLDANSVDAVVTDPPYGLSFMGKKWDYDVPSIDLWREVFRVLKPGAHLLSFGGTRTYHRLAGCIEDAGFDIRDQIQWLYGSGFPKSLDVSKAIDKAAGAEREVVGPKAYMDGDKIRTGHLNKANSTFQSGDVTNNVITAPATDAAKAWQGWGTALKPACEPIVLARKPLEKGLTVAANVLKWGTGAINVDGARIGTEQTTTVRNGNSGAHGRYGKDDRVFERLNPPGRWPANVLLGCDCGAGEFDESAAHKEAPTEYEFIAGARWMFEQMRGKHAPDCAVAMLDEQSGHLHGAGNKRPMSQKNTSSTFLGSNHSDGTNPNYHANQGGGASRFFYVAKASRKERNAGLEGMPVKGGNAGDLTARGNSNPVCLSCEGSRYDRGNGKCECAEPNWKVAENKPQANVHPTVKPIKLMEYLCKLICPPGGRILDPFAGSGSTGVAAKRLGFEFIGIEREEAYVEIARKRLEHADASA